MTREEEKLRDEIINFYLDLKSTDENKYEMAYNYLILIFYEEEDIDGLEDVNFIDQYQIIQSITYVLLKGLIEAEDYSNVALIIKEYDIIKNQVGCYIDGEEDLLIFQLSNDFFEQQLDKILKQD